MATIEYGRPSAFSDIGSGGVRQTQDWWDDEKPTNVTVTTTVMNAGTGSGRVEFWLGVLQDNGDIRRVAGTNPRLITVPSPNISDENSVSLTLNYRIPDNEIQYLIAEIESEDGTFKRSEELTVNSYTTPPPPSVPDLRSSAIRFTVT